MTTIDKNDKGATFDALFKLSNNDFRWYRIISMLLDHFIMCLIVIPLGILILGSGILMEDYINRTIAISLIFTPMFLYLNKDFLNAKSPAKRILGLQVIDRKTGTPASEIQCFIRNLTICVAWPLEVIISFFSPERRIGDLIANTRITTSEKEKLISVWHEAKRTKLKLNYIALMLIGALYFYGISFLLPGIH